MANKTWNGSTGTWATAASWSPAGVPATTDDVFINGGSVTVAAQTCRNLTIGGTCTIAGTSLTVTGPLTINSGTFNLNTTAAFVVQGNITNSGGSFIQNGAGQLTLSGTTSVDANFGDNNLRQMTVVKTGSGGVTFTGSQVNIQGTNSNSSIFTYTSGAIIQNVVIVCGGIVNTSATARIWAMNADLILSAGGNAIGCSMNSAAACTFSSRSGTVRIRSLTNGGNNTIIFPAPTVSTTAASSYTPNVSLESNTNWSISGSVNNIAIDGQHTGTAGTLTVYGTITSNSGDRTWTTCTLLIYNATNGGTSTISAGYTTFLAATIANISGTNATFTINSLKAVNITCSGTTCTYNLGVQNDDNQIVTLSTNATLTLSGNTSTFNLYNVRSYNTTMSSNGSYNVYKLEPNYYLVNPPTAGTTTHSAGTLTIKSGYTLTTYAFTSNSGTRTLNFEDNSYITTLNTGPLLIGYTSLTSYCPYDNAGFLHQSTGQFTFTGTPSGSQTYNVFNLSLYKVNNSTGATTVRNLTINDGAGMTTVAAVTFCYKFTGATNTTITGLNLTRSTTIGAGSYVNYTGGTIGTFTNSETSGANQYIYNLTAQTITLGCTNGAWVYIGGDGTNTNGTVKINTTNTVTLGGACTYYIYNLRAYNLTLSNSGRYDCYYYEHNYATNPPTAGTVTHTAGTLVLKTRTAGYTMTTWSFTSTTGTRGITFETDSYINTVNNGTCSYQYGPALTCSRPETMWCGFIHDGTGAWQADFVTTAPTASQCFNFYWSQIIALAGTGVFYARNLGNQGSRLTSHVNYTFDPGWGQGSGAFTNTSARTIFIAGDVTLTGGVWYDTTISGRTQWLQLYLTYFATDSRTQKISTLANWYNGSNSLKIGTITLNSSFTGTLQLGYDNYDANKVFSDSGDGAAIFSNFVHNNGTLDVRGRQMYLETSYSHTDTVNLKYIINSAATYSDPSIYINATTGTPWSIEYTSILYSNWKIWVKIRGGTVRHGSSGPSVDRQPSFDLSERAAAYTIPNRLDSSPAAPDFCVGSLRINNYTVPNYSNWTIGGPEFKFYTGGLSAPANFTVNIYNAVQYSNTAAKGSTQMYVDNNTFAWPQVNIGTDATITCANFKFNNINIDGGTTTSSGQFVEVVGTLGSSGYGGGTLNISNSEWVFRGSGTVIKYIFQAYGFNMISDSTGTATFEGLNGTNQGDQFAGFLTNFGGKIVNKIGYNTGTGIGTLYLTAGVNTDTTVPLASQIDFNYSTSSITFILDKPSQSAYGFPIKGSTFNIGTSSAGYRYLSSQGGNWDNWGIYNTESTTVSGNYLNLTNCPAKGGGGWYAGANSVDNGGNTGWYFYAPATFSLNRSAATVDEGGSVTITLTTNAPNGTLVPYTITGITSADISGASLTGNFTVSGGTANVVLNIANDYNTEGSETLTLALNNGAASIAVAVNDTSLLPTYSLQRSAVSVTEGGSFTITLTTTNLPNGTTVPYTITGVSSSDINNASLTGNFTISSNSASLVVNTTWDYVTEGQETFTLTLNPTYGTGSAISVAINNLLHPTYALAASPTTLNEGGNFTITLTTTDVPDNTTVPYTITGTVNSADINGASLTGNFTVVSNTANIVFTATGDYVTEGTEDFVITLNGIGTTVSVAIYDYYKTRTYALSTNATTVTEGDVFTITLTTTNVFDSTTVPYTITGVSSSDINNASLTGNFTITSNSGTQTFTTTADLVSEGTETFTITLGTPASGSINVSIKDPVSASTGSFLSFFD